MTTRVFFLSCGFYQCTQTRRWTHFPQVSRLSRLGLYQTSVRYLYWLYYIENKGSYVINYILKMRVELGLSIYCTTCYTLNVLICYLYVLGIGLCVGNYVSMNQMYYHIAKKYFLPIMFPPKRCNGPEVHSFIISFV